MRKHLLSSLLLLIALGCASGAAVAPEAEEAAKKFVPPSGKAQVYVVRPSGAGVAVFYQVKFDGRNIGSMVPGTFVLQQVAPGRHQVVLFNESNETPVTVDAEAGKNYFVRVAFSTTASRDNRTGLVSEEEGRDLVRGSRMAVSAQVP